MLIKAVAGGGGRGMRRVDKHADFDDALAAARREAESAFGDPRVLIEKYIEAPRHIEFQVFGDASGQVIHLNERDCSLQRRHQKVIEEAPAPGMTAELRAEMGRAAVEAARAIGYVGAGTVEFIASAEPRLKSGGFWFMEMNTRLQVEHPVTEAITGFDLVEWQFRIAAGETLAVAQDEVPLSGHAVEARLYAEDPDRGFLPSPGRIVALDLPHGEGIRVDAGVAAGLTVPPEYDPMIAKVIAHGATREEALDRLAAALDDTVVIGPRVNTPFLRALVTHPRFRAAKFDTGFIDAHLAELIAADPAEVSQAAADGVLFLIERERRRVAQRGAVDGPWPSPWAADDGFSLGAPRRLAFDIVVDGAPRQAVATWGADGAQVSVDGAVARHNDRIVEMGDGVIVAARRQHPVAFKRADTAGGAPIGEDAVRAPMNGKVIAVMVAPGEAVKLGARVAVMEAMKMEHSLTAPRDGTVADGRRGRRPGRRGRRRGAARAARASRGSPEAWGGMTRRFPRRDFGEGRAGHFFACSLRSRPVSSTVASRDHLSKSGHLRAGSIGGTSSRASLHVLHVADRAEPGWTRARAMVAVSPHASIGRATGGRIAGGRQRRRRAHRLARRAAASRISQPTRLPTWRASRRLFSRSTAAASRSLVDASRYRSRRQRGRLGSTAGELAALASRRSARAVQPLRARACAAAPDLVGKVAEPVAWFFRRA